MKCALIYVRPTIPQLFYIGVFAFAGKFQRREATEPIKVFSRWGYLSATPIVPLAQIKNQTTSVNKRNRRILLKQLLKMKRKITVNDYIAHLDGRVSRRVAELDLKEVLHRRGRTRSAKYS